MLYHHHPDRLISEALGYSIGRTRKGRAQAAKGSLLSLPGQLTGALLHSSCSYLHREALMITLQTWGRWGEEGPTSVLKKLLPTDVRGHR